MVSTIQQIINLLRDVEHTQSDASVAHEEMKTAMKTFQTDYQDVLETNRILKRQITHLRFKSTLAQKQAQDEEEEKPDATPPIPLDVDEEIKTSIRLQTCREGIEPLIEKYAKAIDEIDRANIIWEIMMVAKKHIHANANVAVRWAGKFAVMTVLVEKETARLREEIAKRDKEIDHLEKTFDTEKTVIEEKAKTRKNQTLLSLVLNTNQILNLIETMMQEMREDRMSASEKEGWKVGPPGSSSSSSEEEKEEEDSKSETMQ